MLKLTISDINIASFTSDTHIYAMLCLLKLCFFLTSFLISLLNSLIMGKNMSDCSEFIMFPKRQCLSHTVMFFEGEGGVFNEDNRYIFKCFE